MTLRNSWQRKALAIAAVALLSVPSAVGVQRALEPTRGMVASWLAAAGFEAVYLATAVLILSPDLRRFAQRVALAAVATAVSLNALADYAHRVPGGLASWQDAQLLFDPLAASLALAESLPLAALAYAMATLLHRLAEAEGDAPEAPASLPDAPQAALLLAREAAYPQPVAVHAEAPTGSQDAHPEGHKCPSCGAALASAAHVGAAKRWGHCPQCKPGRV